MSNASPDIDRGWAFVVFSGSFLIYVVTFGIVYTPSVFYTTFLEVYEQSPLLTAWAVNLVGFGVFFFDEIARIVISAVGQRWTVVIGTGLSSLGLLLTAFASKLELVVVTFGLMVGIGSALTFIVAIEMISIYFCKLRATMFLLISSGGGVGQFVYAPLLVLLFETYSCSGGLLILSGINLHLLISAAIFMPPRSVTEDEGSKLIESHQTQSETRKARNLPTAIRNYCRELRILSNPLFLLFCIGNFMGGLGVSIFFTHIVNFSLVSGLDVRQAASLPSLTGVGSLVARLTLGFALRMRKGLSAHVKGFHSFFSITMGLSCCACCFTTSYIGLAVISVVFGASFCVWGILPEAIAHLLGLEKLSVGVSLVCITASIGMMSGGPFASWVYEVDPSYWSSFLTGGLILVVSGIINFPAWIMIKDRKLAFRPAFKQESSLELTDL